MLKVHKLEKKLFIDYFLFVLDILTLPLYYEFILFFSVFELFKFDIENLIILFTFFFICKTIF